VIGKSIGEHSAAHLLALEIDLRDEIDRAFLVDAKAGAATRGLNGARREDDLGGRGEKQGISQETCG
jgi:hypothetical protein